jgi:hypothetical protein
MSQFRRGFGKAEHNIDRSQGDRVSEAEDRDMRRLPAEEPLNGRSKTFVTPIPLLPRLEDHSACESGS